MHVDPCEDMLHDIPDALGHYRGVGEAALQLLTDAMVLAGKPFPTRILDLPCGGGRVTRHLVRFFPEADILISDVDRTKVEIVGRQFGVRELAVDPEFAKPIPESFDLIFVGSLVTHFDERLYRAAFHALIEALRPEGLLVLTTSGRTWAAEAREVDRAAALRPRTGWSALAAWLTGGRIRTSGSLAAIEGGYARSGFGYTEVRSWSRLYGRSYGSSWASPSWLMREVETRPDVRILALKERGYDNLLDALILQKLAAPKVA